MKRSVLIVVFLALGGCQTYPAHPPTCPPGEFQAINPKMMRGDAFKSDTSDSRSFAKHGSSVTTGPAIHRSTLPASNEEPMQTQEASQ